MKTVPKSLLTWTFLLAMPAFAVGPTSKFESPTAKAPAAPLSDAERYARRCQSHALDRDFRPQGTMLWGTKHSWDAPEGSDETRSVLVSVGLQPVAKANTSVKALRLENGRLVASPQSSSLVGTVLQGTSSDGKPVEVALCGAEPSADDPGTIFYRIEAWNPLAKAWDNPCVPTSSVPDPRAVAVSGVWDGTGARHDVKGKFTLACENGAITKCIRWGYKPWEKKEGKSLADLHQACTRMARADYCGNGQNHTHQDTIIDMYDQLGLLSPTAQASSGWDPARASFEAAWAPDGATCLARTRDGRDMETILQECPGRFRAGAAAELGQGDRCTVQRADVSPGPALLRNRSYGPQ